MRTGTAVGFRASHELCSNFLSINVDKTKKTFKNVCCIHGLSGRVFYVHRGAAVHSFLLDATDGKDASGVRRLTVRGLPLIVSPVVNTGASVPHAGSVLIGADMLAFYTNAPYLALDLRYQVAT